MRILSICGSLQQKSANLALLRAAQATAPEGVEVVPCDLLRDLPHFNPDLEAEAEPTAVRAWRAALAASDALLIASPEYGLSLPGVLKNGIDWAIGSGELERKVVAITAAVPAAERGRRGLKALSDTLAAVSARVVGGEPIVRGPNFEVEVAALMAALVARARRTSTSASETTQADSVGARSIAPETSHQRHAPALGSPTNSRTSPQSRPVSW